MANDMDVSFSHFFYRENANMTIDAICGVCFSTAATARNRADLHQLEATHVCQGNREQAPHTMTVQ
jgi:hypothetical protein